MRRTGLVTKVRSGFFTVQTDEGPITCRLRGKLKEEYRDTDICTIGDRVTITVLSDGTGVIEEVAERERVLSRADPHPSGRLVREQVLIANPDQAVFVFAVAQPEPRPRMLDRLLVAAEKSEIPEILIAVNKLDLADIQAARGIFDIYEKIGYEVLYLSAATGMGIDELRERLCGKISILSGPSGVGKTSLLNRVQPGLGLKVREVSRATRKGRHTTRTREMIKLDCGGYVADTPGIRAIAVWDVEPDELDAYYIDIKPFVPQCQFADCTHRHEPGCAVRRAVEEGKIHPARYDSYLRLREEIEAVHADWD